MSTFDCGRWSCRVTQPFQRTPLWSASWLPAIDKGRSSKSVEVLRVWKVYDERLQFLGRMLYVWMSLSILVMFPVLGWFGLVLLRLLLLTLIGSVGDLSLAGVWFLGVVVLWFGLFGLVVTRYGRFGTTFLMLLMVLVYKAVKSVLDAMIRGGVSFARSVELTAQWDKILAAGPCYPVTHDDFGAVWVLGIGEFHRVVSGLHRRLSVFIHSVVVHRRDDAIRGWRSWIREDPLIHPYKWLRPDLVPPAPFLQCKPHLTPGGSGVLADPARIDEEFRKAWLPYFCRSGQRETSLEEFDHEVGRWLPLLPEVSLPRLTGQVLADVVQCKSATAGSLDGWGWRELKVLPVSWCDELTRILTKVEDLGVWPYGLLDAYIAMIPETDGDATPLGQRPLGVLPIVYHVWTSARVVQLGEWFRSWVPDSVFSAGGGRGSEEAWYTSVLDIEEVLSGASDSHLHLFVADVIKSFDTVDWSILDRVLSSLGLLGWFRHAYFEYRAHVRFDVRDLGGHLDTTFQGWSSTLAARVRLVISRLILVFVLPLDFHGRVRVVRSYVSSCCSAWY